MVSWMTNSREAHERTVFEEFATIAGLPVERGSVVSEQPPHPDIRCRLAGRDYYFELARLVDPVIPERVMESLRRLRRGEPNAVGGAASFHQPLVDRIRDKTANCYDTAGAPVDLLLYYDSEVPAFEFPPPGDFHEWAEAYMLPEIQRNAGQFSRFWVFDRNSGRLLWRFERNVGGEVM
jgi:hypothetical protein